MKLVPCDESSVPLVWEYFVNTILVCSNTKRRYCLSTACFLCCIDSQSINYTNSSIQIGDLSRSSELERANVLSRVAVLQTEEASVDVKHQSSTFNHIVTLQVFLVIQNWHRFPLEDHGHSFNFIGTAFSKFVLRHTPVEGLDVIL